MADHGVTTGLVWTVGRLEPSTTWRDEPGPAAPAGWYVFGTDPEADPETGPRVVLHVQHAVGAEGEWLGQALAEQVAGYLGAPVLTWHPLEAPDDGMVLTEGESVEIPLGEHWVIGETIGEFRLSTREVPGVSGG